VQDSRESVRHPKSPEGDRRAQSDEPDILESVLHPKFQEADHPVQSGEPDILELVRHPKCQEAGRLVRWGEQANLARQTLDQQGHRRRREGYRLRNLAWFKLLVEL
jgi:hypothetical protein